MGNACPVCGQIDQVQKISAIRSSGISTGSFAGPSGGLTYANKQVGSYGGYTRLSGSTATQLAQELALPERPKPIAYVPQISGTAVGVLAILFTFLFLCGAVSSNNPEVNLSMAGLAFVGGLLASTVVEVTNKNKAKIFEKEYRKEIDELEAKVLRGVEIYNRAYYCFRDDQIFDPQTMRRCSPGELNDWLYNQ